MPISTEELARRIKAARESAGLSQEAVAQSLSIPRSAVAQIEGGNRKVSSLELERFAYLVGRTMRDFVQPSFDEASALAALFRLDATVAGTAPVIDEVRRGLAIGRELTNLERLLGIDRIQSGGAAYSFPPPRSTWEAVQQGSQVAEAERQRLGLGHAPIANLAELMEGQGIRIASVELPNEVSGFTLHDPESGPSVFFNGSHHDVRCRFSLAHEYLHVILDRDRLGVVSRTTEGNDALEVRANAFAAAFLLPEDGLLHALERLGKPFAKRSKSPVFGAGESVVAESKAPYPQPEIQLHDVALLSVQFGVSVPALVYRLFNLDLISKAAFETLRTKADDVNRLINSLGLERRYETEHVDDFKKRFLGLALESYRREQISRGKVREVGGLVGLNPDAVDEVLREAGLDDDVVDVIDRPHKGRP